ncbi:MAG: carboxypeptidase regulatory-like domain-containing protein [Pirellulales bacterium]|nr:carboxypeptidase regulatory-like domain-containing protein [Pirellulales bacterium]
MHEPCPARLRAAAAILAASWALAASPALAHKIHVFAYAEGHTIRGEAYARDGGPVRDAAVTAFGPGGVRLGEATTDAEGKFTFEARFRCDHRLAIDAGGGHAAEFTVSAEELPKDLPARASEDKPQESPIPLLATPQTAVSAASPMDEEALLAKLEAVDRQIVQLRMQIDGYEQKVRLHDVLGGLGYILGLMGVAYYFFGRRKKDER